MDENELERLRDLDRRAQAVREAWAKASEADDYPQGFGWPGDLYDALEAL